MGKSIYIRSRRTEVNQFAIFHHRTPSLFFTVETQVTVTRRNDLVECPHSPCPSPGYSDVSSVKRHALMAHSFDHVEVEYIGISPDEAPSGQNSDPPGPPSPPSSPAPFNLPPPSPSPMHVDPEGKQRGGRCEMSRDGFTLGIGARPRHL